MGEDDGQDYLPMLMMLSIVGHDFIQILTSAAEYNNHTSLKSGRLLSDYIGIVDFLRASNVELLRRRAEILIVVFFV